MTSSRVARALVLVVGGILLAVSPFLAWVRILGLFNVDLFTLLRAAGDPSSWAWAAVVIGVGVAVAGIGALYEGGETIARVGAAAVAVVVLAAGTSGVTQLVHVVTESRGLVGFGPGLVLAGLSEVAIVLGVALPRRATSIHRARIQKAGLADDGGSEGAHLARGTEPVVVLTRSTRHRGLVVPLAILIVCGVGVGAYAAGRLSAQGHSASSAGGVTTTPALPMVTNCGGSPVRKPASLHWCTSMCSSYMTNIVWKTWGPLSATGDGTWVTKTSIARPGQTPIATSATGRGVVSCGTSTPIHHPDTRVLLSNPEEVTVCPTGVSSARRVLVFTSSNLWTKSTAPTTTSTPALVPQICG